MAHTVQTLHTAENSAKLWNLATWGRAKPWDYWHSDNNGTRRGKPMAHRQIQFLHTAHLHIQEEDIFGLRWVWEGCKKDNINSEDRVANRQPSVCFISWQKTEKPPKTFLLEADASVQRLGSLTSRYHSPLSTTSHTSTLTTSSVADKNREGVFIIHVLGPQRGITQV